MRKLTAIVIFSSLIFLPTGGFHFPNEINEEMFIANMGNSATTPVRGIFTSNGDAWTTGGPYGGYVNSLAMAGANPDIIYAETNLHLFKTTNGGDTWTGTGFPPMLVRVVQVDPDNSEIVYAGTDDGIYKSENGGSIWVQKGLSGARVNAIVIDPVDTNVLYAGTGWPLTSPTGEIIGIYKSTDAGDSWELKYSTGLDAVATLLIDANNSSTIYAGVYTKSSGPGLRKSINGGEDWVSKQVGPYNWDEVVALAMSSAGPNPVLFAVGNGDVFKSTNNGEDWTATETLWISPSSPWALAVDPNNSDVVYVGTHYFGGRIYKSENGGDTWLIKADGLPPSCPSSIVIDPRDSDVYAGLSDGGVFTSTDGAESWEFSSEGMIDTYIRGIAVDPTSSNTVFAAIKGDGHYLASTTNGGTSWEYKLGSPTNLGAAAVDPQNPSTIFAGDGWDYQTSIYIYKSTDGGQIWTSKLLFYISGGGGWVGVSDIWINPSASSTILVAIKGFSGGVYRSINGGSTWQLTYSFWASTLADDPNNNQVLYFGSERCGYVFRSTDGGGIWQNISPDTPPGECWVWEVRDIEVDLNSHVYATTDEGLMVWDGLVWTKQTGLPTDDITALTIDKSTSPGTLYIGTGEDGVYISQDGGSTWSQYNEGLGNLSVTKLTISANQPTMLYVGTAYGGVWRSTLPSTTFPVFLPLVNNGLP